jgi:hypothetical protein
MHVHTKSIIESRPSSHRSPGLRRFGLLLVLAVSLTACGGEGEGGGSSLCGDYQEAFSDALNLYPSWDTGFDPCDSHLSYAADTQCDISFSGGTLELACGGSQQTFGFSGRATDRGANRCGGTNSDGTISAVLETATADFIQWSVTITDGDRSCPFELQFSL